MPDLPSSLEIAVAPAVEAVRRQWQQPLGDIHNKLGNIVGAGSLAIAFDCNDQDFVFALTSRWPLGHDFTHSLYETDMLKLADTLNGLVRLYAIETGQERLHVVLEARRGKPELPGWWRANGSAPVMFATYAFDTNFAQVGLFGDLTDAYTDMDLLNHPHRLLVAIGPATPIMVDADGGEIELDADEDRLASLKRWNQRLALQINQLLAATFGGGEAELEAVVEALSKVRDLSSRLAVQLIERESRLRRRSIKRDDPTNELYDSLRPRAGMRAGPLPQIDPKADSETRLGETLAGLQTALKSDGLTSAMNPAARADLQKSLDDLVAAPNPMSVKPQPKKKPEPISMQKQPERRAVAPVAKSAPKPGPSAAMIALLCLLASGAIAKDDGHFGVKPYRDTMKYYEYADNDDPRVSSGGNGRTSLHSPVAPADSANKPALQKKTVKKPVSKKPAKKNDAYRPAAPTDNESAIPSPAGKWEEDKNNCAGKAAKTARRRYGNVAIETYSDGEEGEAIIDGQRYTYRCSGNADTGLLEFRADKGN